MMRIFRILSLVMALTLVNFTPAQGDTLPDSAYITGVVGHAQKYSLSCESRSAADWAAYFGVSFGEIEFLEALPRSDNPDQGFVGNPRDKWGAIPPNSYGVHADPVAATLSEFGVEAHAGHGLSWDDLRAEISAEKPVIVWVIGPMWNGSPVEYKASDGSVSVVAQFEHTMILTGYSANAVQVVDAYTGQYQSFWLDAFLKSWGALGNMAVTGGHKAQDDNEPIEPQPDESSYTVQSGDYLVALAERFGTSWQELVELNSIPYPWTIFTGQVLKLPAVQEAEEEPAAEPTPESTQPETTTNEVTYRAVLPVIQRGGGAQATTSTPVTPPTPTPADAIVVKPTPTLVTFGYMVGADWHALARLHGLHPSYVLYPGQVLK